MRIAHSATVFAITHACEYSNNNAYNNSLQNAACTLKSLCDNLLVNTTLPSFKMILVPQTTFAHSKSQ